MKKNHSIFKSFVFAINGVKEALKSEPNLIIHLAIALLVIIAAYFLKFNNYEWVILTLTIAFVITLELINTILEFIVDLVSPEIQEKARIAKDISAAIVLVGTIASVIIGVFLFLPYLT